MQCGYSIGGRAWPVVWDKTGGVSWARLWRPLCVLLESLNRVLQSVGSQPWFLSRGDNVIRSEFLMENSGREGKQGNQLEADSESRALLCLPSGLQEPLPGCLLQHLPHSIRTTCLHICLPIHSLRAGSESQLSLHLQSLVHRSPWETLVSSEWGNKWINRIQAKWLSTAEHTTSKFNSWFVPT